MKSAIFCFFALFGIISGATLGRLFDEIKQFQEDNAADISIDPNGLVNIDDSIPTTNEIIEDPVPDINEISEDPATDVDGIIDDSTPLIDASTIDPVDFTDDLTNANIIDPINNDDSIATREFNEPLKGRKFQFNWDGTQLSSFNKNPFSSIRSSIRRSPSGKWAIENEIANNVPNFGI
uniref:INCENP_ARK-bind domain-containing protein n=1 Tax=Rhabditophanes sp. KR3021 TaxID=114890 RepID=A0AC35TJY5_9BILA